MINNIQDIDKISEQLQNILMNAAHDTIPKIITNKSSKYWWTKELTIHRKLVYKYKRIYKAQDHSPKSYNKYTQQQQLFKQHIREAKQQYRLNINKSIKLRNIQRLITKKIKQNIPDLIDKNNQKIIKKLDIADELIDEFCPDDNVINTTVTTTTSQINNNKDTEEHITIVEEENMLMQMPPRKAADFKGIQLIMLQQSGSLFQQLLLKIYNKILEHSFYPESWKIIKLLAFKKKRKHFIYTIKKLIIECEAKNVFDNKQFGFRKRLGTEDAQLFLSHHIATGIDKQQIVTTAFLDVSKAFNSINPTLLITKLKKTGISAPIINFVKSFCEPRNACVSLEDGITSKFKLMNYGAPQDKTLKDLKLELQIDKIQLIHFHRKRFMNNTPLIYNRIRILPCSTVNYLGLIYNNKFKWDQHIESVRTACVREFDRIQRWLSQNKCTYDTKILIGLYKTLIIPKIVYGAAVWSSKLPYKLLKILQKIQKQFLLFVLNVEQIASQVMEVEANI
ncbi:unnamed protein product [Didymodactylos carnosus]|uniref:Reverse transcriptase domain-containing protein n=1 Tax=Didymodactylos carnosus TaxID=1234261 RepID=A0A815JHN0_9BILA|nr:unnamed protein product [Didymodactylos carnosus]CAF4272661.1 unnamed protein product [Didymodactylos carnosus]